MRVIVEAFIIGVCLGGGAAFAIASYVMHGIYRDVRSIHRRIKALVEK